MSRFAAALGAVLLIMVTGPVAFADPEPDSLKSAPRKAAIVVPPRIDENCVAVMVSAGVGDYRAGDEIWCESLQPADYARALNRDVLIPRPAGRFLFGRLINRDEEKLQVLPLEAGGRQVADGRRPPRGAVGDRRGQVVEADGVFAHEALVDRRAADHLVDEGVHQGQVRTGFRRQVHGGVLGRDGAAGIHDQQAGGARGGEAGPGARPPHPPGLGPVVAGTGGGRGRTRPAPTPRRRAAAQR